MCVQKFAAILKRLPVALNEEIGKTRFAARRLTAVMKTKADLADFLRNRSTGDVSVPYGDMIEIFDLAVTADTINEWLKHASLNFEASPSMGTVPQWSFHRKK
jgi:hypothetical protein